MAVADRDAFNWGYDPVHFGVPEGSYSEEPSSTSRVRARLQADGGGCTAVALGSRPACARQWGSSLRALHAW
jgi:hypothetical protein